MLKHRQMYYYLDKNHQVHACEPDKHPRWQWDDESRRVAKTTIGDAEISTVFLLLDHSFDRDGPPILFETMIFGGIHDLYQERYRTWDEAEAGHARAVHLVQTGEMDER